MKVELIYDAGCPDVAATRSALVRALMETGVDARWTEWDRAAPDSPDYVRRYASPTILVDGADAGGALAGCTKTARDECTVCRRSS